MAQSTAPIFAYVVTGSTHLTLTVLGLALLLFFQHRENIARLLNGTESTIGGGKKAS